ncbi:MAG TPA: Flp pilus assembly protein CpaB [Dehalococcoidia bacterium]|nr:Flp pilus assembly protein CpaB [Dehalococcoidia bacterium]
MIKNQTLIKNNRSLLLLSLLLGGLAALLIVVYLNNSNSGSSSTAVIPRVSVVVAKENIVAGARITPAMLEVRSVPTDAALVGVFTNVNDLKDAIAQVPIIAGEQILPQKVTGAGFALAQFGDNPPLSLVVPSGMRAISVKVDEISAAGGLVRPGDYVDVIMVENVGGDKPVVQSCYVVQNVRVLAIAQDVERPSASGASSTPQIGSNEVNSKAGSATVALTPQQIPPVSIAAQRSVNQTLLLALRPYGDHDGAGVAQCAL